MNGDGVVEPAIVFGLVLIVIGTLAWFANRRWPLAGVVLRFAAAAMATRFAIEAPELETLGIGETAAFRIGAGLIALAFFASGMMQLVAQLRGREPPSGGE